MPKFKVLVRQFVEEVATIEVQASDAGMAAQLAKSMALEGDADWEDGNDTIFVDVRGVHKANGTVIWEI